MSGLTIVHHVGPSPDQWDIVIRGMRNSWESHEKADSRFQHYNNSVYFELGEADRALAVRLVKLGADHGKFTRQLPIVAEVKAPGYWWREMDTYRVGVEASDIVQNSTSMMHVLGRDPFTAAMFAGGVPQHRLDDLNALRDEWIAAGKRKGPEAEAWRALQQAVPYGWLYTRTVSCNYQVARSIYHARKSHRLAEWRTFCAWLETLAYSVLITEAGR